MLSAAKHLSAHRERPEARAQGDKTLPILVGKIHNRRWAAINRPTCWINPHSTDRYCRSSLLMNIIVILHALQYTPHIVPAETALHHVQPSHAREKLWL